MFPLLDINEQNIVDRNSPTHKTVDHNHQHSQTTKERAMSL